MANVKMFKTRLRRTLTILGLIWGILGLILGFIFTFPLEGHAPAPFKQIIALPLTIVGYLFSGIFTLTGAPRDLPLLIKLILFISYILLPALIGAAIGFVCAFSIEKLTRYSLKRKGSR